MADDLPFAFAGLWERWRDQAGETIETCTILTTKPNSLVADVHDRMPVMLRSDDYELWLDLGITNPKSVADCLRPFDAALMKKLSCSVPYILGRPTPKYMAQRCFKFYTISWLATCALARCGWPALSFKSVSMAAYYSCLEGLELNWCGENRGNRNQKGSLWARWLAFGIESRQP